jgi:hydrogenase expression/formation protein HypC
MEFHLKGKVRDDGETQCNLLKGGVDFPHKPGYKSSKELLMCLAVPLKVLSVKHPVATVDIYGTTRDVSLLLLPDDIQVGDYVLVHAGFAIQKIDEDAARETLDLLDEMARTLDQEPDRKAKSLV